MRSRRALIIGIHPYKSAIFSDVRGAASDANSLAQILSNDRFQFPDKPHIGPIDGPSLKKLRANFLQQSKDSEVVLVYFAGHGIRVDVNTYLVPSGAELSSIPTDFLENCLEVNRLIHEFREALPNAKKIFIFDCCRNSGKGAMESAAGGVPLRVTGQLVRARPNELIVHAASLDQKAYDSDIREATSDEAGNGVFVQELLAALREPDKVLINCLSEIAESLRKKTKEQQIPAFDFGEQFNDFFLQAQTSLYKSEDVHFNVLQFDKNITAIDVSASGGRIAVAYGQTKADGEIKVMGLRKRSRSRIVKLPSKPFSVEFSPDGEQIIFGLSNGQVGRMFADGQSDPTFHDIGVNAPVNCLEWARKYDWIVAGASDGLVRLLESETLTEIGRGKHWSSVWCASFHRDGEYFVTGSKDGNIRVWRVGHGKIKYGVIEHDAISRRGFDAPVRCVRFSRFGQMLAVGTEASTISVLTFDEKTGQLELIDRFRNASLQQMPHRKRLLKKVALSTEHKTTSRGKKKLALLASNPSEFQRTSNYVLSLDFSPDESVLAYSSSFNGYAIYALDEKKVIAGISTFTNRNEDKWPRANALRFCGTQHKLYAGVGRKVHVVSFA